MSEINLTEMKEALKPFGNVRELEISGNEFRITITGFKNTPGNFMEVMQIMGRTGHEFPHPKKIQLDDNTFHVIAIKGGK